MKNTIVELNKNEVEKIFGGWSTEEMLYAASPLIGAAIGFGAYVLIHVGALFCSRKSSSATTGPAETVVNMATAAVPAAIEIVGAVAEVSAPRIRNRV